MRSPTRALVESMTAEAHAIDLKQRAIALRCQAMRDPSGNARLLRQAQLLDIQARAILRSLQSGRVA